MPADNLAKAVAYCRPHITAGDQLAVTGGGKMCVLTRIRGGTEKPLIGGRKEDLLRVMEALEDTNG